MGIGCYSGGGGKYHIMTFVTSPITQKIPTITKLMINIPDVLRRGKKI
jgi:hypothetical protein